MRSSPSVGAVALVASWVPALVGMGASAALAVDYGRAAPVFCTEGGGCDAVRHTAFAALFGVLIPLAGIAGFGAIGVVAMRGGRGARIVELALSVGAALVGIALFTTQLGIGHFCPFCCAADASGVAAVLAAVWRRARIGDAAPPRAASLAAGGLLLAAGVIPVVAGLRMTPPLPAVIRAEIASAPPGSVAVVDFVDFECPFCRMTNAEFAPLLAARKGRIHLVRRQTPLRIHAHAMDAARAACCGERLGQGDAMADALFHAEVSELTPGGCERVATSLGLPLAAYRACIADPATDAQIEADRHEFKAAGGFALPTIWIGDVELIGAQPADALAKVLDAALSRLGPR